MMLSFFVAHPELPYVTLRRKTEPPTEYYYFVAPKRTAAKQIRIYYRELTKHPTAYSAVADLYLTIVEGQANSARAAVEAIRGGRRPGADWRMK
jgi:hypothetical protein